MCDMVKGRVKSSYSNMNKMSNWFSVEKAKSGGFHRSRFFLLNGTVLPRNTETGSIKVHLHQFNTTNKT